MTKRDFVELSKLKLSTEELNPVYINLDQAKASLSVQAPALRAEQAKVAQAIAGMNDELDQLRKRLVAQPLMQTRLARSVENAKQVYDVLLQRREEAKVASASQTGSVRLVAAAVVTDVPVGPRKVLNMTLAAILGLMTSTMMLAFVIEYFAAPAPVTVPSSSAALANPGRGNRAGR